MKTVFGVNSVISESAIIGSGTKVWHNVQIGENTKIGNNCVIGSVEGVKTALKITAIKITYFHNFSIWFPVTIPKIPKIPTNPKIRPNTMLVFVLFFI